MLMHYVVSDSSKTARALPVSHVVHFECDNTRSRFHGKLHPSSRLRTLSKEITYFHCSCTVVSVNFDVIIPHVLK